MTAVKRTSKDRRSPRFGFGRFILYALSVPFGIAALASLVGGSPLGLLVNGAAFGLVAVGARLTGQGIAAQQVYDARTIASPPRLPMKLFGALAVSAGAGVGAWYSGSYGPFAALGFFGAALVGHVLFFGPDPRKAKGEVGGHGFTPAEVAAAVDEARAKIEAIKKTGRRIKVREFTARLNRICDIAGSIVTNIEQDPGDLRRARKFLNIYLDSARQVTEKYAKTHENIDDAKLEHNFRDLLVNMENAFEDHRERLLRNDKLDLDVEMEVLSDQLRREGII